jgi:hypothetical protein
MKHFKSFLLKTRFIWLGIKSVFKLNIGDRVKYKGHICVLTQGVHNPKWHMHDVKTDKRFEYVHKNDFKKMFWVNVLWDIKSTYRFYMMNWYDIFMRVIPMSKCWVVDYSNYSKYKTE